MSQKTIFITGGLGFIGSNYVYHTLEKHHDYTVIVIDNYSLAGTEQNLNGTNITLEKTDIRDLEALQKLYKKHKPDYIVNFAAESHNDRAISSPTPYFETNVLGCQYLLECSRKYGIEKHLHVSTIEVYGEQGDDIPYFTETSPLNAKTPYSCAKAGGDLAVRAYMKTYNMPIVMTHCANNYGPFQYPEKFVPVMITNLIQGKKIPLYGDGLQKRDWLHVRDHCLAVDMVLHHGRNNETYDISARHEKTNLEIAKIILQEMSIGEDMINFVADRPNHDRRYLIEPAKIERELGFRPQINFEQGIKDTVNWYLNNQPWWKNIIEQNKDLIYDWSKFKK